MDAKEELTTRGKLTKWISVIFWRASFRCSNSSEFHISTIQSFRKDGVAQSYDVFLSGRDRESNLEKVCRASGNQTQDFERRVWRLESHVLSQPLPNQIVLDPRHFPRSFSILLFLKTSSTRSFWVLISLDNLL